MSKHREQEERAEDVRTCVIPSSLSYMNSLIDRGSSLLGCRGFFITLFSERGALPALVIRAPKNVIWAQETFCIGIHSTKYFLGPKNKLWGRNREEAALRINGLML